MRKRLYFLLPNRASAQKTMNDLLIAQIGIGHIHFVARSDADLDGLHEANILQTSDLVHGAGTGLIYGGITGVVAGTLVSYFSPIEGVSFGAVPLAGFIGGALIGAWAASMIGSSVPNSQLEPFRSAVDAGQILLMVDVPNHRWEEIEALLKRSHPEAEARGLEPNIPAFP
jgi:hypothetical protein